MTVHFSSLGDVREFVSLATLQSYEIQVVDGEHAVNAKSFMEMFTLDFTHPLAVAIEQGNESHFAHVARNFLVTNA